MQTNERLQDNIKDGAGFVVSGQGPSYTTFQRMAAGLVEDSEQLPNVSHRFHFCVDGDDALVLWFCSGVLYQKRMKLAACRSLLDSLEVSGFRCEELN